MDCTRIFVRDFKKSWYLCGINQELDTADKLASKLRELSAGTSVITIGSSAGGFAAVLFGCLLGAEAVLTFSGQFTLDYILEKINKDYYRYLYEHLKRGGSEYYDLSGLMRKHKEVPVFYFCPVNSEIDKSQYSLSSSVANVKIFRIKSSEHGYRPPGKLLKILLHIDKRKLLALHKKCGDKPLHHWTFEYMILGFTRALPYFFMKVIRKIRRKLIAE